MSNGGMNDTPMAHEDEPIDRLGAHALAAGYINHGRLTAGNRAG
ncbi:hypothetical protein [Cerasicoccus arenae]|nr:hypothetical protein [Cerasicoccus arenae]